ncbi:hypothetical protein LXL04_016841 [Taraxacum kok-saghyz]
MKVMKSLKSLKFWSKKKKKKKINNLHHQYPPQCCCHHHPVQPSAPPLPTWLDYENQTYNQHLLASEEDHGIEHVSPEPVNVNPPLLSGSGGGGGIENPGYGVPVLESRRTERSAGGVGCVFDMGAHLFRCFFPCFHIREV